MSNGGLIQTINKYCKQLLEQVLTVKFIRIYSVVLQITSDITNMINSFYALHALNTTITLNSHW